MTVRIITGDCREELAKLPAESVDMVLADPPYGETSLKWDKRVDGWLDELRQVMKPSASLWCFGSLRSFMACDFSGWSLAQDIVWEKHNGSGNHKDRFRRVHEAAAQFYPSDAPWEMIYKNPIYTNDATARTVRRKQRPPHWGVIGPSSYASEDGGPRLMRSVFYARSCHGDAVHPTQKPVAILQPLVEYSCPPGGIVLDPMAGSGSTGIAAKSLGRNAILIELIPEYADLARRRIADDVPLLTEVS